MKKRYEFILEQKNDLVTAKDSLMLTIQEVEQNRQFEIQGKHSKG
jgi:chromosome segregation protein